MAIAVALSFPSGKFHATPWGRHVNEGVPEWPPSPWRFLRALVATWKRKLNDDPLVAEHIPDLLAQLAEPPVFKLPPATVSHTRHYMPWYKGNKFGPDNRTMVFDTFVVVGQAELGMLWPDVTLTAPQEDILAKLLAHLGYLGRAEAWCIARICKDWDSLSNLECGWLDVATGEQSSNLKREDSDPVRVLCADKVSVNKTWRDWSYGDTTYQPSPSWNLLAETTHLHDAGWSSPPGSRWIIYFRSRRSFTVQRKSASQANSIWLQQWNLGPSESCVVRYSIVGAARPLVQDTVYFGEIVRRYLQGIFGKQNQDVSSPRFSGKEPDGTPLTGHQHAFYLPLDEDGDGKLDHLLIVMPPDMSVSELRALNSLSRIHGPSGTDLMLVLEDIRSFENEQLTRPASRWRSITPFVATRHYKERGANRDKGQFAFEQLPEMNLREEIANRGLPAPTRITAISEHWLHGIERELPWREFRQQRVLGSSRRGSHSGRGFEIEFAEPVCGPIAFGYASHFGLGLFLPIEE
jgi:CRISPR-associated protein Csb2